MKKIRYSGYRFPREIIHQAIWLYFRFTLSFHDVEDLLAERGILVSPGSEALLLPQLLHFCSGETLQNLSGVDNLRRNVWKYLVSGQRPAAIPSLRARLLRRPRVQILLFGDKPQIKTFMNRPG